MPVLWVGLLPVLLIVLLLVVFLVSRAGRRGPGIRRRPRKRHVVTRIVCGTLGLAIVIAVGVSTYRDVNAMVATEAASQTVLVPTLAAPPVPEMPENVNRIAVSDARFLVHWIFLDPGRVPVHVETLDVRYEGRCEPIQRRFTLRGERFLISLIVGEVAWRRSSAHSKKPELRASGTTACSIFGPRWTSSRGSANDPLAPCYLQEIRSHGFGPYNPLSVVASTHEPLHIVRIVERVAPDDPLKEVPVETFRSANAEAIASLIRERENHFPRVPVRYQQGIPGIAMIGRFGPVCLLLLAAAILFTQLFIWRPIALAGMLAVMVLYVAALDRAVLGASLSRLADTKLPVTSRVLAAQNARMTFFYAETARERYDAVIEDRNEPEALKDALKELRRSLPPDEDPAGRTSDEAGPGQPMETAAPVSGE